MPESSIRIAESGDINIGPLRQAIEVAAAEYGVPMKDLTVMSPQVDPFRLDTPAMHRDGRWLADTAATLGLGARKIHLRGLHYMILGQTRPDGSMYVSDDESWTWLEDKAGKAARWLGYLPFDQVTDQRNAVPVIRLWRPPDHVPYIAVGIDVEVPDADDLAPEVMAWDRNGLGSGFVGVQPYKLVMVGEKSSLDAVLAPIAEGRQADLYLPSGDISDTMIHQMAAIGAAEGRPMVVLYFADADPAGWNMGIVIARKLQAFKILHFPELEFQVHRVALTPDQVREFGLPSTPLKATEKRAGAWFEAFAVEQTEIDALATLRPDLLRLVARDAIAPFYDRTLADRVRQAYEDWQTEAQEVVDNHLDPQELERIRADAAEKLDELREQIDAINDALRIDPGEVDLPEIVVPEAELTHGLAPTPLIDSGWSFTEATRRLIDSRAYRVGGAP